MNSAPPPRVAVVIEDDADIRNLLEAILGQAGFTCYTAGTGPEGIEAIRRYEPILTTLDISLPGIDGFEVARQIRDFSSTYIVMLSARDEEIDTLMGLDAGADDYLTKPFRPRELRARIEAMLRRYHLSQPMVTTTARRRAGAPAPLAQASPTGPEIDAEDDEGGWLSHNGLRINAEMWLCDLDGAPVELTRSEFDLLLAIMSGRPSGDLQGHPGAGAARRLRSRQRLRQRLRPAGGRGAHGQPAPQAQRPGRVAPLHRDRTRGGLPSGRGPAPLT